MDQSIKYKFSNYNHSLELGAKGNFLYNALTGGFCKISNDDIKKIFFINNTLSNIKDIDNLDPNIVDELKKGGFIVDKDLDELNLIKSIFNINRFADKNSLTLTLMPTMLCNFRCPYCYEKDRNYPNQTMSKEVIASIIDYIDKNILDNGYLNISWYGGEPLLKKDIVFELQSKINELANKKNITVSSGMITNGYFLTKEVSDKLYNLGIYNIQVTIDGTKEIHDKKRILSNGDGSFDVIMSNLKNINENIMVAIRINIDKNNVDNAPELIKSFVNSGLSKNGNIHPYFALVKDYDLSKDFISDSFYDLPNYSKEEVFLNNLLLDYGFKTRNITPRLSSCGAISPNTIVIEPDGTIHKCWHTVGKKENAIGNVLNISSNDSLLLKNEVKWYAWSVFDNKECTECSILPICMGGCPYFSINKNEIFEKAKYKCDSYKFNIDGILETVANNYLNTTVDK